MRALRSFKPEAHRCQLVRRLDAVEYIDDSKGTNVGATIAALQGLGRPIVLIAGGDGKGQDFAPLIAAIQNHARHVLLIGRDGPKIAELLQSTTVPFELCNNLESAVLRAAQVAQAEEAVLLSPACASLDMFRNYKHRAEVFVEQVNRLQSKPVEDPVLVDDGGVL